MAVLKALRSAARRLGSVFGKKVTTYRRATPATPATPAVPGTRPAVRATPASKAGDSGTFGSQEEMDSIYRSMRKRPTSTGYTVSKK